MRKIKHTRVICSLCKREVNGRKPANMAVGVLWPYRHLPPAHLGRQTTTADSGWFGHGLWCQGSWMNAQPVSPYNVLISDILPEKSGVIIFPAGQAMGLKPEDVIEATRGVFEAAKAEVHEIVRRRTMNPLTPGTKVRIEKGCKARGVTKNSSAVVKAVEPMGAEYNHNVRVLLTFSNSFLSGKTLTFYARHENRLSDVVVSLNDGQPEHKIQVIRR